MIEVIMPAAWNAIVLDGYAMSMWSWFVPEVAGGMWALCSRHNVVLHNISWTSRDDLSRTY